MIVLLDVAVTLAAVPVVLWFSVGKLPATAAATEVPFPYSIPVTVVLIVRAGVVPPDDVPANPLVELIVMDDTPVPEGAAHVPSALKKFEVPPPEAGVRPCNDDVNRFNIAVTCVSVRAIGAVGEPVLLPMILFAAKLAIWLSVTDEAAIWVVVIPAAGT